MSIWYDIPHIYIPFISSAMQVRLSCPPPLIPPPPVTKVTHFVKSAPLLCSESPNRECAFPYRMRSPCWRQSPNLYHPKAPSPSACISTKACATMLSSHARTHHTQVQKRTVRICCAPHRMRCLRSAAYESRCALLMLR